MTMRRAKYYLKRLLRIAALIYIAICLLLVTRERTMLYLPRNGPSEPVAAGLPNFTRGTLTIPDTPAIPYWENSDPTATKTTTAPIILYFHGNGGGLFYHVPELRAISTMGFHLIAMEYPGYPGAEGEPSQDRITQNAIALYDATAARYPHRPIVIWGYSLGSGVGVALAAKRPTAALVLEAPFTATVDRAQELFPIFPIHALMRDQYRSRDLIGQIHTPLFIMHGDDDLIIPERQGQALYALANPPKTFRHYAGYGHLNLDRSPAYADAAMFIREALTKAK